MILNLKRMNKQTKKIHFKMDTITSIMRLIRPTCYFTKVDLKDAYYSVQIHQNDTKLLKFIHRGKCYKFLTLPNGHIHGPRKFTKIMKIPISELNKKDVDITPYLDDCLILSSSFELSFQNTKTAIDQFKKLGFFVHGHPKSSFIPAHFIEFLGLNSINMTICLTKPLLVHFTALIMKNQTNCLPYWENNKCFSSLKIW